MSSKDSLSLHKPVDSKKEKRMESNGNINENSSPFYTYEFHRLDRCNQAYICKCFDWCIFHHSGIEDCM